MVGLGHGTFSNPASRNERPGTSTPSRNASVPSRQAFSSKRNKSTSAPVSRRSTCCADKFNPASASGALMRASTARRFRTDVNKPSAPAHSRQKQSGIGGGELIGITPVHILDDEDARLIGVFEWRAETGA